MSLRAAGRMRQPWHRNLHGGCLKRLGLVQGRRRRARALQHLREAAQGHARQDGLPHALRQVQEAERGLRVSRGRRPKRLRAGRRQRHSIPGQLTRQAAAQVSRRPHAAACCFAWRWCAALLQTAILHAQPADTAMCIPAAVHALSHAPVAEARQVTPICIPCSDTASQGKHERMMPSLARQWHMYTSRDSLGVAW